MKLPKLSLDAEKLLSDFLEAELEKLNPTMTRRPVPQGIKDAIAERLDPLLEDYYIDEMNWNSQSFVRIYFIKKETCQMPINMVKEILNEIFLNEHIFFGMENSSAPENFAVILHDILHPNCWSRIK